MSLIAIFSYLIYQGFKNNDLVKHIQIILILLTMIMWMVIYIITKICINIIEWVNDDGEPNVTKLTLLWTICAFIIALLFKLIFLR